MKIAYLILAHNTPAHLQRLVTALSSDSSGFFIHIDKKSAIDKFSNIKGDKVHFIEERIPVFWGDFSQVEATLILLQAALADPRRFDRFVLLSGADYPLRSASYIERFFAHNQDKEFMNMVAMPSAAAKKPLSLLTTYRVQGGDPLISRIMQKVLLKLGVLPAQRDYRIPFHELAPYGGATWWALSREACEFIQSFWTRETQVVAFFKNTVCPDESFFHTILGNSRFKSSTLGSLTYADWSAGGANPAMITEAHLALFQSMSSLAADGGATAGEMLFARKFPEQSADLIAKLEKQMGDR
jgi:Core-2/I-Branching enzyme